MIVLFFGIVKEITGVSEMEVKDCNDLYSLKETLLIQHPALKNQTFQMAVNKKIFSDNISINDNDVIALLPPFSGG
ncbi:MAG TPA: MoaD/ThiS family protein [Bacteroidia bacterium]|nr:MoaD/ThiS family protein [Bacteroidia bacterium]HNT79934.1 MoaD/ThiS family protein [Bacteroidia bacterium]